ncbi:MAG: protein kinase, partial [Pirellulaceae bacterium]|nr:protein kinase [Pirellulaceae bacterium]
SAIPSRSVSETADSEGLSDYRLIMELGSGSFGQVFRAEQVPLERNVALKLLKERIAPSDSGDSKKNSDKRRIEAKNEFLREAKFTGRLEHPNIVSIHDIGLIEDKKGKTNRPFYVMKEIRGNAWNKTIATRSRQENLEVFNRLLDAMAFAHSKKILHCDIKPENVMLGEFGEVLVVDWGQAIEVGKAETYRPGGSPAYVSPEMAEYWCDIHLDGKTISKAISRVGVRSDVYLLGAVLFEIVVGKPPHYGSPGESATDVMRHAIKNQIRPYEHLQEDELLQIALTALRVNTGTSYETVEELQQAISQYEARRGSIEIRERAESQLEQAQTDSNYDSFQKARFGFEESLELWPENEASTSGLEKTRREFAGRALADENYDLGLQVLEQPKNDAEVTLRKNLESGKRKQSGRKQLVRLLSLSIVLAALVFVALQLRSNSQLNTAGKEIAKLEDLKENLNAQVVDNQKELDGAAARIQAAELSATDAENLASFKVSEAKEQINKAQEKILAADALAASAKTQEANAKNLQEQANRLTREAQAIENEARVKEREASELKIRAAEESRIATQAIERTQFLKVKDQVSRIRQTVEEGDLLSARNQLSTAGLDTQAWELSRLNLLSHPEVLAVTPEQDLLAINATADGSQVVMVFPNKIEIRNGNDLSLTKAIENLDVAPAKAALSQDGKILAVGFQAQSGLPTQIRLYDLDGDLANPTVLTAQAEMTDLQISGNGRHLIAVGSPSVLAKATGTAEKEMMAWKSEDENWLPTPVQLTIQAGGSNEGGLPQFTAARISRDGLRIVTTNPGAENFADQKAHVFQYDEDGYQWIGETASGINVATFANPTGTELIGCATNSAQQDFSLVQWDFEKTSQMADRNTAKARMASYPSQPNNDGFKTLDRLEDKAVSMAIIDGWIIAGLLNKVTRTWRLEEGRLVEKADLGGREQAAKFVSALPAAIDGQQSVYILSASVGTNAEIRMTDLLSYRDEVRVAKLDSGAKQSKTIIGVPYRHQYSETGAGTQTAVGTDKGWVMVGEPDGTQVQWEVSAWREHLLTDQHLFARTNTDDFFRYDRESGVLEAVITALASRQEGGAIEKVQISQNGRIAVVSRQAAEPVFEIWDLNSQTLIRKIPYRNNTQKINQFAISDDGNWVVGVKIVGYQVWSVETGQELATDFSKNSVNGGPPIDWPNVPLNTVRFLPNSSAFLT